MSIDWKAKQFKCFWEHEVKWPNRKAKIDQDRLCLREANRSFNNNYIIKELEI